MAEWIALARESTPRRIDSEHDTNKTDEIDDERYLDVRRIYDDRPLPPQVIVDVGANDG